MAQGRDSVKDLILDNPELMLELETRIRAKIKDDENALLDDTPIGVTDADDEGEIDD